MIVAIYKDSGPTSGCGQDVILTAPREEAHIFPTYEDFRRADYALLKSSERKEARYIKWYEATDAIHLAAVATALCELRTRLVADANAMATHGSGTSACTIQDAFDATIAKHGVPPARSDSLCPSGAAFVSTDSAAPSGFLEVGR
jgi:hypothetical protein